MYFCLVPFQNLDMLSIVYLTKELVNISFNLKSTTKFSLCLCLFLLRYMCNFHWVPIIFVILHERKYVRICVWGGKCVWVLHRNCACKYINVCVCDWVSMCVYVFMSVYMFMYIGVCICVCVSCDSLCVELEEKLSCLFSEFSFFFFLRYSNSLYLQV